jgi:phosphatidylglycerophosphate synthase
MRKYTVDDIRRSYTPAKAREEWYGDWPSALIYRPLSFILTPILLSLSVSASMVTLLSLALGLALPLIALYGGRESVWMVATAGTAWMILDCVDGNIARVTETSSLAGRYFDAATDVVFRGCFYVAIGILIDAEAREGHSGLALCLAAGYAAMAARFCRLYFDQLSGTDVYSEGSDQPGATSLTPAGALFAFLSGIDRLLPLVVFFAAYWHRLSWVAWFLLSYGLADLALSQFWILQNLRGRNG